jgi:hypothetical protein
MAQERDSILIDSESVDEHGAFIQETKLLKPSQFFSRLLVNSLAGMHDEGTPLGCGRVRLAKVASESQRVAPAIFANHANREILPLRLGPKRVVVTDSGDSTEQVSDPSPPKANILGHAPMFRNQFWKSVVYVLSPLNVILIWTISQPGEEGEFQMIMCIDKARHQQQAAEVELR